MCGHIVPFATLRLAEPKAHKPVDLSETIQYRTLVETRFPDYRKLICADETIKGVLDWQNKLLDNQRAAGQT